MEGQDESFQKLHSILLECAAALHHAGVELVFRENQQGASHLRLTDESEIGNNLGPPATNNGHNQSQ